MVRASKASIFSTKSVRRVRGGNKCPWRSADIFHRGRDKTIACAIKGFFLVSKYLADQYLTYYCRVLEYLVGTAPDS